MLTVWLSGVGSAVGVRVVLIVVEAWSITVIDRASMSKTKKDDRCRRGAVVRISYV